MLFSCIGRGSLLEISHKPAQRYTEQQLIHFIDFIQSPHITTDIPFGERTIKLSSGSKIIVPDVIRNIIPSRIVSQYLAYCEEADNADSFKPLAESSLFAILHRCGASTRKSRAGLDNFSCDGSTAFDRLRELCDEMATYGDYLANNCSIRICCKHNFVCLDVKPETVVRLKEQLHNGRNYSKLDFKTHILNKSRVADHCSTYALSDLENSSWCRKCDHDHDEEYMVPQNIPRYIEVFCYCRCDACLALRESLLCLRSLVEEDTNITEDIRQRLIYRLNHHSELVDDWKKHLLRTVHQDCARTKVLEMLDHKSVFLIADWAMKWLPTKYRESQRDFFGKRGLPWHTTYAIRVSRKSPSNYLSSSNQLFEHRTFCHVFDNAKQDGHTVASILSDVIILCFICDESKIRNDVI